MALMALTPEMIKEYADRDSRSLSQVETDDLIFELMVRATETRTRTKLHIIKLLRQTADEAEIIYNKSLKT